MNKLIAILAALIVAFFVYNSQKQQDPDAGVIPVSATLEERFRALLAGDTVDAEKLATFVEQDPNLAVRLLRDRLLTITGTIESFRVTSTDRKVLRMRLRGSTKGQVCLTFDLKRYNTTLTTDTSSDTYEVVGHEVLYFKGRGGVYRKAKHGKHPEGSADVIYRAGERIKQRARFDRIGLGEIHFNAE